MIFLSHIQQHQHQPEPEPEPAWPGRNQRSADPAVEVHDGFPGLHPAEGRQGSQERSDDRQRVRAHQQRLHRQHGGDHRADQAGNQRCGMALLDDVIEGNVKLDREGLEAAREAVKEAFSNLSSKSQKKKY